MRVSNMSDNDYYRGSVNGDSDGRQDHQGYPDHKKSEYTSHPTVPLSPQVSGLSQSVPHTNGGVPVPIPMASPSYLQARQPINDAVTSAFHTTDSSMSPELIQLITQNVIQQMQAQRMAPSTTQPVQPLTSAPMDQHDNASSFCGSPTIGRSQVYTPPSPHRPGESFSGNSAASPMPTASKVNAHGYETGIRREPSPFSRGSDDEAVFSDIEPVLVRPAPIRKNSTQNDSSLLEKVWGKLFDEQGNGTEKLGLFLRGIASHLIEDYEPKRSLVVTPKKMQRYYEETRLTEQPEIYPWQHIFDDKTSSISRLLREPAIKVQHHLMQSSLDARPDTPGLTPHGFATWMTLLIQAHPDQEFERLAKTAREMPISNPDYDNERFPKELSRRSFPAVGDSALATTLAELMTAHCKVQIYPRQASTAGSDTRHSQPSPPLSSRRADPPPPTVEDVIDESEQTDLSAVQPPIVNRTSSSTTDSLAGSRLRETVSRSSVSTAPSDSAMDQDGSDVPTPRPIERERKPYVGSSSGGKSFDIASLSGDEKLDVASSSANENELRRTKSVSVNQPRQRPPPPIAIHQRHNVVQADGQDTRSRSTVAGGDHGNSMYRTRSNSSYIGESQPHRRTRSNSTYANDSGTTRYHPNRSPSFSKSGFDIPRSSAPDMKPSSRQPPTSHPSSYSSSVPQSSYDHRNQSYDSRDPRDPRDPRNRDRDRSRDRDYDVRASRPRMQSMAAGSVADAHNYGDEYHRQQSTYSTNGDFAQQAGGQYQYPPTAYRDNR